MIGDKREYDAGALAEICQMAEEQRRTQLAAAFVAGPFAVRSMASHEIALVVASMAMCKNHYTQPELEAAARAQMMNDPIFHAAVIHLTALVDEYIAAAVRSRR